MSPNSSDQATPVSASIDYAVATHIGQRREENQDAYGISIREDFAVFAVADGMGGASGGAYASALAVRILGEFSGGSNADEINVNLRKTVVQANQEIYQRGRENPALQGMGTTISGFVILRDGLLLFNVGDSRVYRIRENAITQLSNDHTLVSELLSTGALTQEQASRSPVSHMLTRSVGPTAQIEVDCSYLDEPPRAEDIYLICSDGLYNSISSAEIGYVVGGYRLHDALEHLVALANMRGGADNITGILVECGAVFPSSEDGKIPTSEPDQVASVDRKRFVHVDLAEAAAADTFSRVKKEVDISAEVLWGAHKDSRRVAIPQRDEVTQEPLVAPLPESTIGQRALILCGFIFCAALVAAVWISKMNSEVNRAEQAAQFRKNQNILDLSGQREARKEAIVDREGAEKQAARRREMVSRLQASGEAGLSQKERIEQRRKRLQVAQEKLSMQLADIKKPVEPSVLDDQRLLEVQRLSLIERIKNVGQEVERLDKSLTQWRSRLQEIDEIDTVNLASDLAPYSEELKGRKEAFEQVTWSYLKELEGQKIDPANVDIQKRIEALVAERNQRLGEMAQISRLLIESMIARDSRDQGLLLIEEDALREDEKLLLSEIDYIKVRINGSEEARKLLEEQLQQRLQQVEQELRDSAANEQATSQMSASSASSLM